MNPFQLVITAIVLFIGQSVILPHNAFASEPVVWTDLVNAIADGNTLIQSGSTLQKSGAASEQSISGDGGVEFTISAGFHRMLGLSYTNIDASGGTINYALRATYYGEIQVFESGTNHGVVGNWQVGDVLRVERIGTTIYYKQNGVTLYTSTIPSSGNLIADANLKGAGTRIENAMIDGVSP